MRRDGRQSGSRDRERTWGGLGTKKFRIACIVWDLGDPTLIPYVYYDQIHIVPSEGSTSRILPYVSHGRSRP